MVVNWKEIEEKGYIDEAIDPAIDMIKEIDRMRKKKKALLR